jgi:hypothetical protein
VEFGKKSGFYRVCSIIHKNIVSRIIGIAQIGEVADFDRFRVSTDSFGIDFTDIATDRVLGGRSHAERIGII